MGQLFQYVNMYKILYTGYTNLVQRIISNQSFIFPCIRKDGVIMKKKENPDKSSNIYDDGNIPEIDLPKESWVTEPLPESTRPRKDGPGGDGNGES